MTKFIQSLFSLTTIFAVAGGFIVFVIFFMAIIIGGATGEAMAVFASKGLMPYFIRSASIAAFSGLLHMYLTKNHALSFKDDL